MKKINIISTIIIVLMLVCIVFLFFELISSRKQLTNMKDYYANLSERVRQINNDPILRANNIDKEQGNNLTNEMIQQLSPIISLQLRDNAGIPYSDQSQRLDYIKGYMSAWCNSMMREMHCIGKHELCGDIKNDKEIILNSISIPHDTSYSFYRNEKISPAYDCGWATGTEQVNKVNDKIMRDIYDVIGKYSCQNALQTEGQEFIKDPNFQKMILEIPSVQAFLIIQRILKTGNLSIEKTDEKHESGAKLPTH